MIKTMMIGATLATATLMTAAPAEAHRTGYRHSHAQNGDYRGRVWQDSEGRYRCRRANGTTGLVVGAVGGALLGRAIDGGNHREVGTILGGVGGALAGREVERRIRCR